MAELVKNDKGFKVIKLSTEEAKKLGWGIDYSGECICTDCDELISGDIYYVVVLNDTMCKECYEKKKTMKNGKSGAESFAESMREKLGLNNPLPKEVMDNLREGVIDLGKKTGDTDAEDVLDNCLIELKRLKDDQSKAIVITYLLGTLPMDLQKFIAEQQQRIVVGIAAKNLAGEGPEAMLGMLLMGAMLDNKD